MTKTILVTGAGWARRVRRWCGKHSGVSNDPAVPADGEGLVEPVPSVDVVAVGACLAGVGAEESCGGLAATRVVMEALG
jgi:hypothetical protein